MRPHPDPRSLRHPAHAEPVDIHTVGDSDSDDASQDDDGSEKKKNKKSDSDSTTRSTSSSSSRRKDGKGNIIPASVGERIVKALEDLNSTLSFCTAILQ
jgi:hypothetical protein